MTHTKLPLVLMRTLEDQRSASEWEDGGDKGRARDQDQIEIETNLPYGRNGGMNGNGFAAHSVVTRLLTKIAPVLEDAYASGPLN